MTKKSYYHVRINQFLWHRIWPSWLLTHGLFLRKHASRTEPFIHKFWIYGLQVCIFLSSIILYLIYTKQKIFLLALPLQEFIIQTFQYWLFSQRSCVKIVMSEVLPVDAYLTKFLQGSDDVLYLGLLDFCTFSIAWCSKKTTFQKMDVFPSSGKMKGAGTEVSSL